MLGSNENIPVMTPSEDARSASPAVNLGIPRDDGESLLSTASVPS